MGEEGSQRRSSMSSRPNCEFVIIMVIVAVVRHKGSARQCCMDLEIFYAVTCSSGSKGFHVGPEEQGTNVKKFFFFLNQNKLNIFYFGLCKFQKCLSATVSLMAEIIDK